MSPADRCDFVGHYKAAFNDDVEELVDLCHALEFAMLGADAEVREELERERDDVVRILREEHAEEPAANLLMADREAQAGHWHEVRRRLRVARDGDFQDCRKGHVLHLEGLVLVQEGRPDEAFEAFSQARSYGRALCDCDLRDLELLTRPMADPPEVNEWDDGRPLLRQLVGAIRTADRLRDSGDGEAALAALDRPIFWQTGEVQIAARRAEILLKKSDGSAADPFQKRFTLASFRELYRGRWNRKMLHLPGVTWDRDRIDRIDQQAQDWLETADGTPRS
jgi:hypothetical protein